MNGHATSQPLATRAGAWTVLLVACGLIAGIGLMCARLAGPALSGYSSSHAISSQTLILLVCLICIVVLLRVAHHAEHQLRSDTSVARSYVGAEASGTPSETAFGASKLRSILEPRTLAFGRTYSPSTLRVGMLMFAAGAALFVVLAVSNYSKAQRSAFVQSHGTSTLATVVSVNNTQHCGRYSCHWSATIPVALPRPIDGVSATVVSYPQYSSLVSGERITVLVDPKEPGYAELPGTPYMRMLSCIIDLVGLLVFAGLAAFHGRGLVRVRSHSRGHLASATPAAGLASSST